MDENEIERRRSSRAPKPGVTRGRLGKPTADMTHEMRSARARNAANGGLTAEETELLKSLLGNLNLGCRDIARLAGVSEATVTTYARRVGRSFDAGLSHAALEEQARYQRERRRLLAAGLIEDALDERLIRAEFTRDMTSARARNDLSRSLAALVKSIAELETVEARYVAADATRKGGADVDEWLGHMIRDAETA